MKMQQSFRVTCLAALVIGSFAAYPANFPFDDESYVPPDLVASTPDQTYEDSDPGGYCYAGGTQVSLEQGDGPYYYMSGNMADELMFYPDRWAYALFTVSLASFPRSSFNCTLKETFHTSSDWTGTLGSDTICTSCCDDMIGLFKFGTDQEETGDRLATIVSTGGCSETIDEPSYCAFVSSYTNVCDDNMISSDERVFTFQCFDMLTKYFASCSVYAAGGMKDLCEVYEPPTYWDQLSTEQTLVIMTIGYVGADKVCHPYSYYFPDSDDDSSSNIVSTFVSLSAAGAVAMLV